MAIIELKGLRVEQLRRCECPQKPCERTIAAMSDEKRPLNYLDSPGLLERDAGRHAMWTLSRKYFAALAAAILATVLAKPEIVKAATIGPIPMPAAVLWYLTLGVVGAFFGQLKASIEELTGVSTPQPLTYQFIFTMYVVGGYGLLYHLLHKILS